MKAARPILVGSRLTDLPLPTRAFTAAQSVFESIEGVGELRLIQASPRPGWFEPGEDGHRGVMRTYSYLGLFGYGVDGVIANRACS